MKKKRKKSLVGWTQKDWYKNLNRTDLPTNIRTPIIVKSKYYFFCQGVIKVRITIEEI